VSLIRPGWRTALVWLLALNLVASALSGLLALIGWRFMEALGLSLLIEAGALLIIGGAMGISPFALLSGPPKPPDSPLREKENQRRGALFVALGAVLLAECVLVSLV